MKFVSLSLVLLSGSILSAQGEAILVKYSVVFNQQFDRPGTDIRHLSGNLTVFDALASDFYMLYDQRPDNTESSIEMDIDTVWRVRADLENQEMFFEDMFNSQMKPQWYSDSLFSMKWHIEHEEKVIDSFICNKATSQYRGRQYFAWFCPELSLPFGPWKLGGLPGLIIAVSDSEGNMQMKVTDIIKVAGTSRPAKKNALPYHQYLKSGKHMRNLIMQSSKATDCVECESSVKFRSWEKVFEE